MERKCVKIKSDNPAFPKGYYIQFKDRMKPGDVIYIPNGILVESLPTESINPELVSKPAKKRKVKP
jgi:ribosomal protein L16 Arg81 hydroxylase